MALGSIRILSVDKHQNQLVRISSNPGDNKLTHSTSIRTNPTYQTLNHLGNRLTWEPMVLCLPLPSPAVAAAALQLTIPCESQWTGACTHLVVSDRTASLTGATACAAAEGKPIITADWCVPVQN